MTAPIPPQISLRALREALNMTLKDLAKSIGEQGVVVSIEHLSNVELGVRQASEQLLLAWSRALGTKRVHVRQAPELIEWVQATAGVEVAAA